VGGQLGVNQVADCFKVFGVKWHVRVLWVWVFGEKAFGCCRCVNQVNADKLINGERWRIVRAVESKLWPEATR